jgi:hypothetical protein
MSQLKTDPTEPPASAFLGDWSRSLFFDDERFGCVSVGDGGAEASDEDDEPLSG